jgi:hypothetical protein
MKTSAAKIKLLCIDQVVQIKHDIFNYQLVLSNHHYNPHAHADWISFGEQMFWGQDRIDPLKAALNCK